MNLISKRVLTNTLAIAMVVGLIGTQADYSFAAAKKSKLSTISVSVKTGKTKKVSVKNAKSAKVTWKVKNSKIASVKKDGKYAVKVKGKKKGNTVLTCKVKKKGKTSTLKCKIRVTTSTTVTAKPQYTKAPTAKPIVTATAPQATQTAPQATQTAPQATQTAPQATQTAPQATEPVGDGEFTPVVYKKASFETGTDGFVGRGGRETVASVAGGKEGNCLSVSGRQYAWNGTSIDVTDGFVTGAAYKISAWVKQTTGADVKVKISCLLDGSSYPEVGTFDVKSDEWTYVEGTYNVPESFDTLAVYFESPSDTFDFMVDEMTMTQMTKGVQKVEVDPLSLPSLKDTYAGIIDNWGMCLNYYGYGNKKNQMTTDSIMNFVKKQFNSFTLENEMKPDAVLGGSITKITVQQAKDKGYVIPDNYTEENVPQLSFDAIDKSLEVAQKSGIRMRAHTLMWHQQTPSWFFKTNYSSGVVNEETMDARLEFYIRTVMKHVMDKEIELTGEAGSLVYAWDVVNEYLHHTNVATNPSWHNVYGEMGLEPSYVKKAFEFAYDELEQYDVQDKVTLFNNDYDTYFCADDEVSLVNFINEGEKTNICGGIGMQSHVDVDRPTLAQYETALDKFMATGLEVQVTELDITINFSGDAETDLISSGQTDEDQAAYTKDFMKLLVDKQKNRDKLVNPKGITGVTIWGLYDSVSWRSANSPLFFGSSLKDPKLSFYAMIDAAK